MATPYQTEWQALWRSLQQWKDSSREELQEQLHSLVVLSLEATNRECVSSDDIATISSLLTSLVPASVQLSWRPHPALLEGVKVLRNLCAGLPSNQQMICGSGFVQVAGRLACSISSDVTSDHLPLLTALLQLLGNVCVGRSFEQGVVWSLCFPQLFRQVLSCAALEGVQGVGCMLLHSCVVGSEGRREALCRGGGEILPGVLVSLSRSGLDDWPCILMESLCESCALEQLWQPLSPSPTSQLALLSFLSERLTRSNATSSLHTTWTNEKNVTFLTKEFETCLQALISLESAILEEAFAAKALVESPAVLQMKIAAGFLKLLCCLSASEDTLPSLQSSTALLDVTLAFLKELCRRDGTDASGENVSRLSAARPSSADASHPLYGVKRDLVRLVGNLSHGCHAVQERVREREAIPLVLNQCCIDHHNPYIQQWAVLAIRNLCEGNPANQELIAGLQRRTMTD